MSGARWIQARRGKSTHARTRTEPSACSKLFLRRCGTKTKPRSLIPRQNCGLAFRQTLKALSLRLASTSASVNLYVYLINEYFSLRISSTWVFLYTMANVPETSSRTLCHPMRQTRKSFTWPTPVTNPQPSWAPTVICSSILVASMSS